MFPGDPVVNDEAMRPGQAWVRVRRNRLSCSRDRSRRGGDRSGGRPPEALADGKGMATALEALDLPDLTNRTRALMLTSGDANEPGVAIDIITALTSHSAAWLHLP